jgi:hypothetical protein
MISPFRAGMQDSHSRRELHICVHVHMLYGFFGGGVGAAIFSNMSSQHNPNFLYGSCNSLGLGCQGAQSLGKGERERR